MTCDDTPDNGAAAGIHNRTWNNLNIYWTNMTYHCPVGQAFATIYNSSLNSTCTYQSDTATEITWTYNAGNTLPPCIRKNNLHPIAIRMTPFLTFPCQLTALRTCCQTSQSSPTRM